MSSPPDLSSVETRTNHRPPDINKSAIANAIHETRVRLTGA